MSAMVEHIDTSVAVSVSQNGLLANSDRCHRHLLPSPYAVSSMRGV
jgi:hypothetical protein